MEKLHSDDPTQNIRDKMNDLPIALLNQDTEVISGQHTPNSENHWSAPSSTDIEEGSQEDLDLRKEALGLLDIPVPIDEAGILDMSGVPQPEGLSQDQGDDESTEFFGAIEDNPDSFPPINQKYQRNKMSKKDLSARQARRDEIIKRSWDDPFNERWEKPKSVAAEPAPADQQDEFVGPENPHTEPSIMPINSDSKYPKTLITKGQISEGGYTYDYMPEGDYFIVRSRPNFNWI